jgi:integrase
MPPSEANAKAYMEDVAFRDISNSTKGKVMEALMRYSAWLSRRFDADEWEFSWTFQSGGNNTAPKDFLSKTERRLIREAALEKDGTPSYGIEPEELGDSDEGSWKFTSLVWTSLDTGLRPVEVGSAKTSWVDTENQVLRIPREDSAKNDGNWTVSLTNRTAISLERWLEQRDKHPDYDGMEALWLTRRGNPYGSNELRRLLHDLCDRAGIDYENRSMSWYTIRHSVGTLMTDERDLAATKAQLRHKNPKTTMKYDAVPPEARREALDKMG